SPNPNIDAARFLACASARVTALSSSAHISPVEAFLPIPKMSKVAMIVTFPVGTHFPALIRVRPTVVSLDNSKAHPTAVNTSFNLAGYARGAAYGGRQPFLPS